MSKTIYKRIIAVVLIALTLYSLIFSYMYSSFSLTETKAAMVNIINEIDKDIYEKSDDEIQSAVDMLLPFLQFENSRITVLSDEGEVIAETDKDVQVNENHSDRPEFKTAMTGKTGTSVRYSDTLEMNMLYVAKKSSDRDKIIRIAIPYSNKLVFIKTQIPTVVMTAILTLVIAMFISSRAAKKLTQPLSELTKELLKIQSGEELKLKSYEYKELNDIAAAINTLSERIEKAVESIKEINRRTEYILDNMKDGLVFIDHNKCVIGINEAAREIFDCRQKKTLLNIIHYTRNLKILEAVNDAIDEKGESRFDITLEDERIISVHVSRVMKGVIEKDHGGAIILLIDVTTERKNEELRQNFFANASHELKTPITSIKGYSELLTSDIPYTEEQKKEFLMRIRKESDNMTSLINDILAISRIESGKSSQDKVEFNLKTLIEDIVKDFEPMLNENNIGIDVFCEDIVITEEAAKFSTLFNNLISNAVKYNVKNGSICVSAAKVKNKIYVEVSDTGIGIPKISQNRVFERFYRVDQGRSKRVGGTGLGLSIVKHLVNYYKGTITLESEVDKGTTVKLELNIG